MEWSFWMTELLLNATNSNRVLAGVLSAAFAFLSIFVYRTYFHPLAHIPGPFLAKFSGSWRNSRYWSGTWHEDILDVHRKYGAVVRIAPNELSLVDEQALKLLYGHGHNTLKTDWYDAWRPPTGAPAFFAVRDKKLHSFLRKRVSGAYNLSAILKYESYIQECLNMLIKKLSEHTAAGDKLNMSNWVDAFTFDAVGALAYGAPLGHLETEKDVLELRENLLQVFYLSSCMGHYSGQMRWFLNPVTQRVLGWLGVKNRTAEFQDTCAKRVRMRMDDMKENRGNHERKSDMLAHFLEMKDFHGNPVGFEEVLSEGLNLVGAGAHTTAVAIRACLQAICSRAEVYGRLQAEIDRYYTENKLEQPISYLQCQKIPYLIAVTREAMRLLPSIVFQLLRYTPETGLSVDGKYIPPSTPVGISALAQNRDVKIWGEDADEFRPERWLESEEKARYLESNDMTWGGSGPRMCVGRNVALVQIYKSVAQIVRHFDLEVVDREKPWHLKSYWFVYQHDFMMRLKVREKYTT